MQTADRPARTAPASAMRMKLPSACAASELTAVQPASARRGTPNTLCSTGTMVRDQRAVGLAPQPLGLLLFGRLACLGRARRADRTTVFSAPSILVTWLNTLGLQRSMERALRMAHIDKRVVFELDSQIIARQVVIFSRWKAACRSHNLRPHFRTCVALGHALTERGVHWTMSVSYTHLTLPTKRIV